ncbi:glycosyltransferase family 2 protein [Thermosulfurimonas dismutans]|uniref:Glycosyl transferase, family 2 n=1 Tax=Thermosulfurimonas dismutans TaxID=999894 RepID=A0A179D275_9BACT|nr:glycosyltransferase family 2 protein [Thermosulfurimonas dismutans]OAQ20146.1 Glycosyl transferase, family 2 [Thermosulfurimonas dismutans]
MISVVIPVHNEEKNIEPLYEEILAALEPLGEPFEIIYVNDGSTDGTGEVLRKLKARDSRVRVLEMDRNRGEAAALTAGFFNARGEIVVSMDGDGQNDPAYIPDLLRKLREGYAVVSGWRMKRKEPLITRKIPSFVANRLIGLITGIRVHDNGCSLKAYRAEIVKRIQIPHGFHRFIPAVFGVKNSEVAEVKIIDRPRRFGRTHYGLKRTFEVLRELLTIRLVLKNRKRNEKRLTILTAFLFLGTGVSLVLSLLDRISLLYPTLLSTASVISLLTLRNLRRFNKAQEEGVFKIREL